MAWATASPPEDRPRPTSGRAALGLRWRLTLLASLLIALALLALSLLGGASLKKQRLESLDRDLNVQWGVIAEAAREADNYVIPGTVFKQLALSSEVSDARILRGRTEVWSVGFRAMPDVTAYTGTLSANGWRLRVGTVAGLTVEVGRPLSSLDQTLRDYTLAVVPLAVILALLGGSTVYFVVGRALAPLTQLTRRVGQLDSPEPVPGLARRDEVGQLARALDGSLAALARTRETEKLFLAAASHELRTPVTALRAELEFALARARDAASYREALRRTMRTTAHLERLTVNLLTLTRLRSLPARQEPVDLWAVAADVVDRLMPLALAKGLSLDLAGAPSVVRGDPMLLERLVENLAYNAIRYTASGGVELRVEGAHLRVEDSGPGFPPGLAARLFESTEGFGVGLSLVRQVAAAHGASLRLENCPAGGARAEVIFSEADGPEAQAARLSGTAP